MFSLLHCIGLSPPWRRQSYRHRSSWCIGCIILFAGVIGLGAGIVVLLLLVLVVVVVVACPLCSVWQEAIMQHVYVFLNRNTNCYLPLRCLLARIRCNMSCAGLPRRTERHFMFSACLQAEVCLFSSLGRGGDGFPRAGMKQVAWCTFRRTRTNQGRRRVLATRQEKHHRYTLHCVPLGQNKGTSCIVHRLLRK